MLGVPLGSVRLAASAEPDRIDEGSADTEGLERGGGLDRPAEADDGLVVLELVNEFVAGETADVLDPL